MNRETFLKSHGRLIQRLLRKAQTGVPVLRGQIPEKPFSEALCRSAEHHFRDAEPREREIATYLESLHIEDLALACTCAEGVEGAEGRESLDLAWEHFITEFRPVLYAAARAITGDELVGRELADSIYAELYGVAKSAGSGESRGRPRSLFSYFYGRSKLSTWLRAILVQRHVDAVRAARRTQPLPDEEIASASTDAMENWRTPDPDRRRYLALLHASLAAALSGLEARERLRLSCYYVQDMTLAQVGRLLGEHEATVSRKLGRTRRQLRKQVERSLGADERLSADEIRLCYEYALEEWPFDLTGVLQRQ